MASREQSQIPLQFDPRNNIVTSARHKNFARIPLPDGGISHQQMLRWYPYQASWAALHSAAEAVELIKTKRRHLDVLCSLGSIAVPKHTDFVGTHPNYQNKAVIYSLVDRIADPQPITHRAAMQRVCTAQATYYTWMLSHASTEPLFMLDWFALDQYQINPAAQEGEPAIMMLDIDPHAAPNTPSYQEDAREQLRENQLVADSLKY